MKKFFALFMVIALLAVTGSAFAAEPPTVTLSGTTNVQITKGNEFDGASITITATPSNNGTITGYALTPEGGIASLSGTTITIPAMSAAETQALTAGTTQFTVTATEHYTEGDSAGHISSDDISGTAEFTVAVVDSSPVPTPEPSDETGTTGSETPTVNTYTKTIRFGAFVVRISVVNNPTPENVRASQTVTLEVFMGTGGNTGGRQILSAVINVTNYFTNARNNVLSFIRSIFFGGASAGTFASNAITAADDTDLQVQDNSNLVVTESGKTTEEEVREASAYLQNANYELTAVTVLPKMTANTTGVYLFALPFFDESFYGMTVTGFSNVDENGVESGANVFLNAQADSTCAVAETIPGLETSADILPGFLTFAVYMQAGRTYKPVVAVPVASVQAVAGLGSTETVTVATSFTEVATSTFTNYFDESLLEGTDYQRIPGRLISRASWTDSDAETAAKEANAGYNMFTLAALPAISGPDAATWYIAKVSFDKGTKTAADLYSNAGLTFYPDNVTGNADSTVRFFKEADGQLAALTASEIFGSSSRYTQGYVAFRLAALTSATKPAVTTNVVKSSSTDEFYIRASRSDITVTLNDSATVTYTPFNATGDVTYSVSPSADWVALVTTNNEAAVTVLPTDSALIASSPNVFTVTAVDAAGNIDSKTLSITVTRSSSSKPGSSGGGCSAGFSALALAVLAGFIAKNRK